MQKQNLPITFSLPRSNQESKNPFMAIQETTAQLRPGGGDAKADTDADADADADADSSASEAPEDFEFCILSSGVLATVDDGAAGMCVADEVFSGGKLLPLHLSSAASADAPAALLLLHSDSLDGATAAGSSSGFSSRSDSRSTSSSSSSCVSRSASLRSASSADSVTRSHSCRSVSSFYAHPSPSPRPQPARRPGSSQAAIAARRSTGSPPLAWGVIRLGVVGAPEVYPQRAAASRKSAAARAGSRSRSARFEQPSAAAKETASPEKKKLALGLLGAGLVCNCSPDAVEPVGSVDAAAAAAERRRRKKAEEEKNKNKKAGVKSGQSTVRKSRIVSWLDELSIAKDKSAV